VRDAAERDGAGVLLLDLRSREPGAVAWGERRSGGDGVDADAVSGEGDDLKSAVKLIVK
jgi:hypothetical protein